MSAGFQSPTRRFKSTVSLDVYGFECDPTDITAVLGVAPTRMWRRGEKVSSATAHVRHENIWRLHSPVDSANSTIEEQLAGLLPLVLPHAEAFSRLPAGSRVYLACTVFSYTQRPIITFSEKSVAALAALGAAINVDVYDLSEVDGDWAKGADEEK